MYAIFDKSFFVCAIFLLFHSLPQRPESQANRIFEQNLNLAASQTLKAQINQGTA